ncbi:MAG TPA: SxtJ family membrane protein [Polyangia bacterium]|jgi:hypothetical protein
MTLVRLNRDPSPRQARAFAAGWLPAFLLLVAALAWRRHHALALPVTLAGLAVVSAGAGLVIPRAARALFIGAMIATYPLAWLMSGVLLAVVFYGVLTPVGLLARLCGHDPLRRRGGRGARSYWVARGADAPTDRYFRQY